MRELFITTLVLTSFPQNTSMCEINVNYTFFDDKNHFNKQFSLSNEPILEK